MTGQIPDNVIYENELYDLVGLKGEGLYDPLNFGLTPRSPHTANWRGFVSTYEISNDLLFLRDMQITIEEVIEEYPKINEISPKVKKEGYISLDYQEINLLTKFTGKLLIAKDFIDSMYVHMGFQSPISFEKVFEFEFNEGKLIAETDFSKKMEEYRKKGKSDGKLEHGKDLMKWIERTFSIDYDF